MASLLRVKTQGKRGPWTSQLAVLLLAAAVAALLLLAARGGKGSKPTSLEAVAEAAQVNAAQQAVEAFDVGQAQPEQAEPEQPATEAAGGGEGGGQAESDWQQQPEQQPEEQPEEQAELPIEPELYTEFLELQRELEAHMQAVAKPANDLPTPGEAITFTCGSVPPRPSHLSPAIGANEQGPPVVIHSRVDIAALLQRDKMETGVELGVQLGRFSEELMHIWKSCTKLYLVDIWAERENEAAADNVANHLHERIFRLAQRLLQPWDFKVKYMRMTTAEAANVIPDDSLDFVYLDARTDYCGTMEDLRLYWPKLRAGGILAGRNFLFANAPSVINTGQDWTTCADGTKNEGSVRAAVEEFAQDKGLTITVTCDTQTREKHWPSWVTRKP